MLIYPELQELMLRYGVVLLCGSDVRSHEDFAAVSHSLNCGTPAPRSYCFFCELASSVGGAAPMNSSAEVADVVARLCSGFSQKLAELCVRYVRVLPELTIDGSVLGWSWKVAYNVATKEEAEAAMHKQGTTYWWLLDGYSRTVTAVLPTIHKEPRASEQVFQLRHPAFISWNDVRNSGGKALVFVEGMPWMVWLCGNGDVLPGHVRATSPCACNVTWAATPHFSGAYACPHSAVSVHFGLWLRGLNLVAKAVAVMGGGTEQAVAVFSDCKDVLKSVLNQCAAPHIVVA